MEIIKMLRILCFPLSYYTPILYLSMPVQKFLTIILHHLNSFYFSLVIIYCTVFLILSEIFTKTYKCRSKYFLRKLSSYRAIDQVSRRLVNSLKRKLQFSPRIMNCCHHGSELKNQVLGLLS